MPERIMADHYETLQLSPNADRETVDRVYRLLAKRYHPDNPASGDAHLFAEVRAAYEVLSDPDARAAYDARYEDERRQEWEVFRQETAQGDRDDDERLSRALLSLLYIARRRDPANAGMAPFHLERLLGAPREHLDFPLWYLKKRGFVEVQPNGLLAITVDGVDRLGSDERSLPPTRLLRALSEIEEREAPDDGEGPDIAPSTGDRAAGGM